MRKAFQVLRSGDFGFFGNRLKKNVYSTWDMELFELPRSGLPDVDLPSEYVVRKADDKDLEGIAAIWPESFLAKGSFSRSTLDVVKKFQEETIGCHIVVFEGEIVSFVFLKDAFHWFDKPAVELAKGSTHVAFRGKGIFSVLMQRAVDDIDPQAMILGQVLKGNSSSMKALRKAGFVRVGLLRTRLLLGNTKYSVVAD